MKTEQLLYLLEINRTHSISAAAQNLYMSQTSLSAIVKNIEEELGFSLFIRTPSGVKLTEDGKEALALMKEISLNYDRISEIADINPREKQKVSVLTSPSLNPIALHISQKYAEMYSSGDLEFLIRNGDAVGPSVIKGDASLGLTYWRTGGTAEYASTASKYQIKARQIFTDHLYLVVRKDHPLAKYDSIPVEDISNTNILLLPNYNNKDGAIAYPTHYGPGNRFSTFPDVAQIKYAIMQQNAAAPLSGFALHYDKSIPSSAFKPVLLKSGDAPSNLELCMIYRSEENLHLRESIVVDIICNFFRTLEPFPFSPEYLSEDNNK